ncbi:MAG: hypothetical protein ABIS06_17870 [Vicinamibacterales bacterium]
MFDPSPEARPHVMPSEVHLLPDDRFVYVANMADDTTRVPMF